MASYTTNLNLKKPAGSEAVAIGDINNNMDTIDQAYGTLNDQIATINTSIMPSYPTVTLGSKISSSSVVNSAKSGRIFFTWGYVVVSSAMSANDVIATVSDISYFPRTFWTNAIADDGTVIPIKAQQSTKEIRANGAIASGKVFNFQLIAIYD